MDENMGSLMGFLRGDPEYIGRRPAVNEGVDDPPKPSGPAKYKCPKCNHPFKSSDLKGKRICPDCDVPVKLMKEAKETDPSKPDVDHEAVGAETYEGEDLEKVKSQSLKNVDFAVRKVKDSEVETPIPMVKAPAKESRGFLHLCEDCAKTFRSMESKCPVSEKHHVVRIVVEKRVREGILELVGEIEGISVKDRKAVRTAVESGQIEDEWPEPEDMIDALSTLEDFVDPMENPDVDVKLLYLQHVLVPKALSIQNEGKLPSKDDNEAKIVQKLTEEKDPWREKVVNPLSEALEGTNLGYYYSASRMAEDGTLIYEFTSVGGGPVVEVHVKSAPKAEEK